MNEKSNITSREDTRWRTSEWNGNRQMHWNGIWASLDQYARCAMAYCACACEVEWRGWKLETERKRSMGYVFAFSDTCQSEIYCFHNHLSTKNNTILNINYQISNKDCSHKPRCLLGVPPVKCKYTILSRYVRLCSECVSVLLLQFISFSAGFSIRWFGLLQILYYAYLVHCLIISIIAKSQWTKWNAPARREKNY